jgi:methyl-accepting chemotaxis protein
MRRLPRVLPVRHALSGVSNLSVRHKFLGVLGIVCLVVLLVGYLGVRTAQGMNAELNRVESDVLPGVLALSRTREAALRTQSDLLNALLAVDAKQVASALAKVKRDVQQTNEQYAIFGALPHSVTPGSRAETQLGRYDKLHAAWQQATEQAVTDLEQHTPDGNQRARETVTTKGTSAFLSQSEALTDLLDDQQHQADDQRQATTDEYERTLRLLLCVTAAGILSALALGLYLARSIASPLGEMARVADRIAEGDLDQQLGLQRKDEVGQMAAAFQRMIDYLRRMADLASADAQGDLSQDARPLSERDVLGTAFASMGQGLRELVGQVQASAVALGETAHRVANTSASTGAAVQHVARAMQDLNAGVRTTNHDAQATNAAIAELASVVDGIARGATDQAAKVQAVGATAATMADNVERVAADARGVAAGSEMARATAQHGFDAVTETVAGMAEIRAVVDDAERSVAELSKLGEEIGVIVETIDDIAEQTNLLALNAAIEAARAGEQGRGFAVVANEVRRLAERSQRETKEIAQLTERVQASTRSAVKAMAAGAAKVEAGSAKADQAGRALAEILSAVDHMVVQVKGIADAAQDTAQGANSAVSTMHAISLQVKENTAATSQMAQQTTTVTAAIEGIAQASERQSTSTLQVSASADDMSAQMEGLSAEAQRLAATTRQLEEVVSRFVLTDGALGLAETAETQRKLAQTAEIEELLAA